MEPRSKTGFPIFPAVAILIGAFVLVILAISSASSPDKTPKKTQNESGTTATPLDKPTVDFSNPTLGPKDAKVTLVLFSDYLCSACTQFSMTVAQALQAYPKEVRLVWKDFPNEALHEGTLLAAVAARCADEQGAFWEYHDLLMANQGSVSEESLTSIATALSLDMEKFSLCLTDQSSKPRVERDFEEGQRLRIDGTPYLFINGRRSYGAVSLELLKGLIEAELTAAAKASDGETE
jgi:protein-disulfide isomerase